MAAKTASLSVNIIADAAKAKAGLKEAETAFGKFRSSVGDANGAMGKFKTAAGGAFDYVKANAMGFATAAGTAIGAFVVKSVNDFQNLVLSIGKFSDATGLSMDQASRLVEVAGDIGIEMSTVEKSIGFMNKTLGKNSEAFKELGVEIAYTSGGAADINQTFLNVVERLNAIKDPTEKAALGTKLLGRSWQEMAELIAMGSGGLSRSLAEVESTKVFNEDQLRNAKDLRDSFDQLKGRVEGLSNAIGERLVPVLADAADMANVFFDVFKTEIPLIGGTLGSRFGDAVEWTLLRPIKLGKIAVDFLTDAFGENKDAVENAVPPTEEMARVWQEGYRAMVNALPAAENLNSEIERQQQVLEDAKYAWDLFKGNLSMELERQNLVSDIEEFRKKWAGSTDEAKRKSQEYRDELLRLQIQVANFGGEAIRTATIATQNKIRILVETGQLERAVQMLQYIRNNTLGFVATPKATYAVTPYGAIPARANGGIITKPEFSVIGEAGAEAVIPLTNPTRAMELMQQSGLDMLALSRMGGGRGDTVVNIRVDAGLVSSPDQVGKQIIDAIRRAERRSGQVFAGV